MTAYLYQVVLAVQNKLEIHNGSAPWRLSDEDRKRVVDFVIASIGQQHDLKHVFDLMRYLLPTSLFQQNSADARNLFYSDRTGIPIGTLSSRARDSALLVK